MTITRTWIYRIAGFVGIGFCVYSLILAHRGWNTKIPDSGAAWPCIKIRQVIVLVIWSVAPPMWFWLDYFYIYLCGKKAGHVPPADFELFKYGQDVSAKIWIAFTSVLFVLYFGKDIKF